MRTVFFGHRELGGGFDRRAAPHEQRRDSRLARSEAIERRASRSASASGARSGSAKEIVTACERPKAEAELRVGVDRRARAAGGLRVAQLA